MHTSRKKFLQQVVLALGGTFVSQSKVFSNFSLQGHIKKLPPNTTSPADCTVNLKDGHLFDSVDIDNKEFFYYDESNSESLKDVLYRTEQGIGTDSEEGQGCVDLTFFNGDKCQETDKHSPNDRSALRYKAYYPNKNLHDYNTTPLPVIIMLHAGGFTECSDYNDGGDENSILDLMAKEFAKKGFVCVLAHYRTGRIKDSDSSKVSTQQMLAAYRAMQDVEGCLRSIIKRDMEDGHTQVTEDGFLFKINTNQVFLGGLSAGSIAVLGSVYYRTQNLANKAFVSKSSLDLNIEEALGGFKNNDFYYGSGSEDYIVKVKGVLNCWGGIVFPKEYDDTILGMYEEYEFFESDEDLDNAPMIAFQGKLDGVVPYLDGTNQDFYFSTTSAFKKENYCLIGAGDFKIKNNNNPVVKQGSAYNLYNILEALNRFTELYEDPDAHHGLGDDANYGFNNYNENNIVKYIVERAAIFFQTIMSYQINVDPDSFPPFGYRGDSYFINCKNYRICSETSSNHC